MKISTSLIATLAWLCSTGAAMAQLDEAVSPVENPTADAPPPSEAPKQEEKSSASEQKKESKSSKRLVKKRRRSKTGNSNSTSN